VRVCWEGVFLPRKNAEKRGKTRECWRGEFLTTNDANEGEVVLGDLKFERRGQWSVVSGQWSVVSGQWSVVQWCGGAVVRWCGGAVCGVHGRRAVFL
jgi:hypothetical protein